jgi:uncharacterized protein DUF4105
VSPGRLVLIAIAGAIAAGGTVLALRQPSNDRIWAVDQRLLPSAEVDGHVVRVHNVRNFRWGGDSVVRAYEDRVYDLDKLESVWFVLTTFSKSWRGPAHTFVSFGFADSQYVGISVEARREPGEVYGPLPGLFRRFELMYIAADERDLIVKRAVYENDPVYVYPIRAPREKIRQLFVDMLARANELRRTPEFYNTLTNNCTSVLVSHVNQVTPGRIPHGLKTILPGYSDDVALSLGLIDSPLDLEAVRAKYRVNERAKQWERAADFSVRIRS